MHQPTPADEPVNTTTATREPNGLKQPWVAPVLDTLALSETLAGAGIPGDLAATGAS